MGTRVAGSEVVHPSSYIADFDSAIGMVRALAGYLHGRDFPLLGAMPRWRAPDMRLLSSAVNRMPKRIQEKVYIAGGRMEAVAPRKLKHASAERIAQWIVQMYPQRKYPAVAIGSANGALTHLWAALGIPWLPQTTLIPVRRKGPHPDEPMQDVELARQWAQTLLAANPDVQLHHLHDPNQDRLMIQCMSYFRIKRLRLGPAYEQFMRRSLEPGGMIFVVDCGLKWPTTALDARHIFQFGALGGATPEEYHHGSARVEDYLARYASHRRRWDPPAPDAERPEAEWGFEPRLGEDIDRLAHGNRFRVRRVRFHEPEDASPLVADFYRGWNRERKVQGNRLLIESFIVMEPYWTVRTGSTPFWMVFNKQPSADALRKYLDGTDAFDEIYLMLFSHGVESVGLASIEEWRALLRRARRRAAFVGVDEKAYPRDFAVFVRYCYEVQRKLASRYPQPGPLMPERLDRFLGENDGRYAVRWQ